MKKLLFPFVLFLLLSSVIFSQTVHITKTGKKYHLAGCSYLRSSDIPIELKDAVNKGYSPCSRCNPPTLSSNTGTTNYKGSNKTITTSKSLVQNGRYQAITKKGTQCKRKAKPGSIYCWQHGG